MHRKRTIRYYGTYALGLDRISDGVRVTILEVAKEDNERATPWVSSLDEQYHCLVVVMVMVVVMVVVVVVVLS